MTLFDTKPHSLTVTDSWSLINERRSTWTSICLHAAVGLRGKHRPIEPGQQGKELQELIHSTVLPLCGTMHIDLCTITQMRSLIVLLWSINARVFMEVQTEEKERERERETEFLRTVSIALTECLMACYKTQMFLLEFSSMWIKNTDPLRKHMNFTLILFLMKMIAFEVWN